MHLIMWCRARICGFLYNVFFFFKQKTAYEMRISDWSSDVCSSDLGRFCCFGNIFASAGPDGSISRLDRHETMKDHPVTPMREADLRLHLQLQGEIGRASGRERVCQYV